MYISLFHGRQDPVDNLEDWGNIGPVFGPYDTVHITYESHIKMTTQSGFDNLFWTKDNLIYYDGVYYGDFEILDDWTLALGDRHIKFREELTQEDNVANIYEYNAWIMIEVYNTETGNSLDIEMPFPLNIQTSHYDWKLIEELDKTLRVNRGDMLGLDADEKKDILEAIREVKKTLDEKEKEL